MLARLEESFRRLSDFSSDLAHEFRTPISNLMTQTQVTLSRPRSAEEYSEVLASSIEEYERLSRMIADMLFIAKADEGQIVPTRERLDLEVLIGELVEFHRLAADEKDVVITHEGEGVILGDPLMIRRAISNLPVQCHPPHARRADASRSPSVALKADVSRSTSSIPGKPFRPNTSRASSTASTALIRRARATDHIQASVSPSSSRLSRRMAGMCP